MDGLKQFKKIPIYVVEEHNDAMKFIYSAIGGKKLPVEGTILLHLDSHPDLLIPRHLKGDEARSGRDLLPLLEIENWIVPAAAAGYLEKVIWVRPPWSKQMSDGTRIIGVGDHPETGLLRVNSREPYYLSDALFSAELENKKDFVLTVAELGDPDGLKGNEEMYAANLAKNLDIMTPYVLDIDLDYFSTDNPFLNLYENIGLYDLLEPIFDFELPECDDDETISKVVFDRENQLQELENLFSYLENHGSLRGWDGLKNESYEQVLTLSQLVIAEAKKCDERPDWWAIFAAGCTRDQCGLPVHISNMNQIQNLVCRSLRSLLRSLPPPVLITISRSADDGYCPTDQVDDIQALVLEELGSAFETDEPIKYYLRNSD